ncbi:hypothetical protein EGW08_018991, partial [Elysia chlorotica]
MTNSLAVSLFYLGLIISGCPGSRGKNPSVTSQDTGDVTRKVAASPDTVDNFKVVCIFASLVCSVDAVDPELRPFLFDTDDPVTQTGLALQTETRMFLPVDLPRGDHCVRLLSLPPTPDTGPVRADLSYRTDRAPGGWTTRTGRPQKDGDDRQSQRHWTFVFSLDETARN